VIRRATLLATLLVAAVLRGPLAADPERAERDEARIGYSIGYQVGGDFRQRGQPLDPEMLIRGVLDALDAVEPRISEPEMQRILTRLQSDARAAEQRERHEQAARNLAEGAAFLAENARREGVRTLPSGLQYRILEPGSGRAPEATDTVTVHYRGTFVDGTEFDSSHARGEPATFGLDGVIPGWSEALRLMREGARWRLFVPPELAYGDGDAGGIGPNRTLIFDVELIAVHADR